jgi:hypothetical protein
MTLVAMLSYISADETIHVIDREKTVFFGKVRNAYSEIDDDTLCGKKVLSMYSGFGGMCIEVRNR